jgi:hypothetical protein
VTPRDFAWLDFPMTDAQSFVRDQLSWSADFSKGKSDKGLADFLLHVPLDQGHIVPFIFPKYFDHADPKHGAKSAIKQARPEKEILTLILSYLTEGYRYAVLDHCYANPDHLQDSDMQHFVYESQVYLFLTSQNSDIGYVDKMLRRPVPYPLIGILSSIPDRTVELQNREEVPLSTLKGLADGTTHIIVGAFDACGYLLWTR